MNLNNSSLQVFLSLLCLLLALSRKCYAQHHNRLQLQEGDDCEGPDSTAGVCSSPEKCISQSYEVTKLPPCSASQDSRIICCPKAKNQLFSRHKRHAWHQAPYLQIHPPVWQRTSNYGYRHQNYQNGYNYQNWPGRFHNGHAHYGNYPNYYNNPYSPNSGESDESDESCEDSHSYGHPHHNGYNNQNWYNGWKNDHPNQNWYISGNNRGQTHDNRNPQNGNNEQQFPNRNNGNLDATLQNGNVEQTMLNPVPTSQNPVATKTDGNQEDKIVSSGGTRRPTDGEQERLTETTTQAPPDDNAPNTDPNPVPAAFRGTRISERKCVEYSNHMQKLIKDVNPAQKDRCSWYMGPNSTQTFKIAVYMGQDATRNEFPHMVALGWPLVAGGIDFKCGGALISESYVLTAGHCLSTANLDNSASSLAPTVIRLGDSVLDDSVDDDAESVSVGVKRIIKHPSYMPPVKYFDIGLIEMERKIEFTLDIRPACLWTQYGFSPYKHAVITGWGRTSSSGDRSVILQKAALQLFDNPTCANLLDANRNWRYGPADHQICAGDVEKGADVCQGDSGTALAVAYKDNQCLFFVMGVTSFGRPCGVQMSAGVYTRVYSFLDWIENIVWRNDADSIIFA